MDRNISKLQKKQGYWQKHISAWEAGSQSQKAYCQSNGIALATFGYWKRKLNCRIENEPAFYPLAVPTSTPDTNVKASLAVHIDRFKLEIQGDFCSEQFKKVVTTLEQLT
ncbi:IS66 family insertion sequence element accessory protein TnpA [Desulfosediminicola ganghwensis]|uniref:IS66 family insertion sequence element accessory protein TnpA n=1 Tax=Desulfosediminicola ganghwensis TaxID=2569540 RepID=UPI0010AB889E|nr:hypothetical protein [Desulfosediminicola ganghwensis]